MKKVLLLSVLALVFFTSCRKEKSAKLSYKPISEWLRGTWLTTAENLEYYNSANVKVYTNTPTPGSKYVIASQINRYDLQGNRNLTSDYSVSSTNGKNYITFTDNGSTETFEIVTVDAKTMVWRQEKTNVTYNDNGTKTAAKLVTTINFHCPCRD